jgi:hypothetical protein
MHARCKMQSTRPLQGFVSPCLPYFFSTPRLFDVFSRCPNSCPTQQLAQFPRGLCHYMSPSILQDLRASKGVACRLATAFQPPPRPRLSPLLHSHSAPRVTFPARFSKTYKRTSPRFSVPIQAYTGRGSPCPFSRKTVQIAKRPNTCPPQALAQSSTAVCHLMSPCKRLPPGPSHGLPARPWYESYWTSLRPNSPRRLSRPRPARKCNRR